MRLLQINDDRSFCLTEFAEEEIPRYAILSHVWGLDSDEITYKDILESTGRDKAGYGKLHFCAAQVKKDGLRYCWIDTCCIDKTNAAELTESINSMFRWYKDAIKCYVFLADVSTPVSEDDRDSQLRNSRWFTRGWTLQELIAPRYVEFFSQTGERLGDRKSLERQIHEFAGISIHALRGEPLSHFSIDERMSWTTNRMTKRPEDKVYSLLGIFDIHMEAIYGEGEHHASRRLRRELERYSENHQLGELFRDQLQFSSATHPKKPLIHPKWIVPFERNPRFTGRESELAQLEEKLLGKHRTAKLAVTGLGGIGKTQLVLELLHRVANKQRHCSIIWISAVTMESIHQSYLEVARQLGIPNLNDEKTDVKRLVRDFLSKDDAGQWLLVFDNADDIEMWMDGPGLGQSTEQSTGGPSQRLLDYVPRSNKGSVLFTTRDRKTASKLASQNVVELKEMSEDMAIGLLKNSLQTFDIAKQQQDAVYLVAELTYLPLAIVQAASYIYQNGITLADYLLLLSEQEEEIIDLLSEEFEDDSRYRSVKNPVATTWLISFAQIQRRDVLAAEYLSFMSCVEPKNIPQSFLPPGPSRKMEIDAIGTLDSYSFISRRPADLALDLHRLVCLATRNWLRKEGRLALTMESVIARLEQIFPNGNHKHRNLWTAYLPHARHVLNSDLVSSDSEARIELLRKYGQCIYEEGRWDEAEASLELVMETYRSKLGAEHPDTLGSINNLAMIYTRKGRWDKAEPLFVQVVETSIRVLGAEHPDTLVSKGNLASIHKKRGRWDKAEQLYIQVVETSIRVRGAEHPNTLVSMGNLASIYNKKGRWDEAEQLGVQVMEMKKRVLGAEHPETLTSMSDLASIHNKKGRWDEAEQLFVQVVETSIRVLGAEHPETLTSMNNLALVHRKKGRWDEAEELEVQVMEMKKRVLGAEHPETLTSMNNLAITWNCRGRYAEAISLMNECVRRRQYVLGTNHPYFISSSERLARWKAKASTGSA